MNQTTLPEFKPIAIAEVKPIHEYFKNNGQAYAIVERLCEDFGQPVKKSKLKRAIRRKFGQDASNFSARMFDANHITKELDLVITWNKIKSERYSAYTIESVRGN